MARCQNLKKHTRNVFTHCDKYILFYVCSDHTANVVCYSQNIPSYSKCLSKLQYLESRASAEKAVLLNSNGHHHNVRLIHKKALAWKCKKNIGIQMESSGNM